MKLTVDVLQNYEYAFRQPGAVQPAHKYDNRAAVIQSLQLWTTAQNPSEKTAAPEAEVPTNARSELLAERFAATFSPQSAYRNGKE